MNHVLYWEGMCSIPKGDEPTGGLARDIDKAFGSFANFKSDFTNAAAQLFGSGYVWLCQVRDGGVVLLTTENQVLQAFNLAGRYN